MGLKELTRRGTLVALTDECPAFSKKRDENTATITRAVFELDEVKPQSMKSQRELALAETRDAPINRPGFMHSPATWALETRLFP